ncbi:uncharacterized protein LOC106133867 [Amyelois transitella]|uniref:uncharacterized protein LOC106133867 n=1 Tax=Amyelois transitella TaxID=680683 RepID=UPI00067B4CC2|nr:uncharacterized protein LOC106133867 [Amyelois transitella]
MALLLIYPAITALALFVMMVIILILKFGYLCKLRHTTFAEPEYWNEEVAYEQKVSYA